MPEFYIFVVEAYRLPEWGSGRSENTNLKPRYVAKIEGKDVAIEVCEALKLTFEDEIYAGPVFGALPTEKVKIAEAARWELYIKEFDDFIGSADDLHERSRDQAYHRHAKKLEVEIRKRLKPDRRDSQEQTENVASGNLLNPGAELNGDVKTQAGQSDPASNSSAAVQKNSPAKTADEAVERLHDEWATYAQLAMITDKTESQIRSAVKRAKDNKEFLGSDEQEIPDARPGNPRTRFRIRGVWRFLQTT